jgi:chemotaxis protein histidine kinase CheA
LAAAQAAAEQANQQAAAEAEQALAKELAAQQAKLEAQKAQELAAAQAAAEEAKQQALAKELAAQQAKHEAQKAQELAAAEAAAQELAEEAAKAAAEATEREVLKTAKEQAQAEVEAEHAKDLTEQLAKLEAEKDAELKPFIEAEKARKEAQKVREQIVDRLLENFKDSDEGDVDIDGKTGKVRINFQESYFVRGSAELSDSMKDLLRVMIPKYAKSIYENEGAAKQVESLKISGLTSPIFRGRYFDINDTSPEGEEAREFNLKLSNDRALAMYNFIFDSDEMGDYEYRAQLKADLGIEALGYRTATPVPSELVGQKATCLEYDCKKEQASILEFRLYSEQ